MKPSVGRIVHYVSYGTPRGEFQSECRAAIIAKVGPEVDGLGPMTGSDETCNLVVLNPQGLFFNVCDHDEETKKGGTWHWPERVEE